MSTKHELFKKCAQLRVLSHETTALMTKAYLTGIKATERGIEPDRVNDFCNIIISRLVTDRRYLIIACRALEELIADPATATTPLDQLLDALQLSMEDLLSVHDVSTPSSTLTNTDSGATDNSESSGLLTRVAM